MMVWYGIAPPLQVVVLPFLIQLWMFATPVVYPASLVPEPVRSKNNCDPISGRIWPSRP